MKVKRRDVRTEHDLRETLDVMYQLAKEKDEPFYDLVELMCNEQTIISAIHNIKANKGSKTAGIDGKTIDYYLQMPYKKLVAIVNRHLRNYKPMPVKRKYIPKQESSKLRPLGIPVIIDRIIQEITRIVIEPIAEAKFYQYSFGFRPMRDASQAMAEITERIRRNKTYWVIEGDIKGFFDNINHNKLISMLWNIGIKDKRVLAIIKKMLKSGILEEDGRIYESDVGSPQGGIISPLLANIYLNFFDWMIAKEFLEHPAKQIAKDVSRKGHYYVRKHHKDTFLIRYADDWVILCQDEEQSRKLLRKVEKYFNHRLSLELSKEKTLITYITTSRAKFLGYEFFAEKSRTRGVGIVGKSIPNISKSTNKVREIGKEVRNLGFFLRKKDMRDCALQIEKINSKIVGLTNYYSYAICSSFFKNWDNRIVYQTYKVFSKIQCRSYPELKKDWMCKANETSNRRDRHKGRTDLIYAVPVDDIKIGISKFSFTKSQTPLKVNLKMTPYTEEGRLVYEKRTGNSLPLARDGTIYSYEELLLKVITMHRANNTKYNFEFVMNREYAFNRDKGKCKCCESFLNGSFQCHHIQPKLPLDKVNKVVNLATLCLRCHRLIHSPDPNYSSLGTKAIAKINKYRKKLEEPLEKAV